MMNKRFRLYLDVDRVLVGKLSPSRPEISLAPGVLEFLSYATENFDTYFLSPHAKGDDAEAVIAYLASFGPIGDDLKELLNRIRPLAYKPSRTDLLEGDFYWVTGDVSKSESDWLEAKGFFNNLVEANVECDPDALLKAVHFLREELDPKA